jgi:hypothetical protein
MQKNNKKYIHGRQPIGIIRCDWVGKISPNTRKLLLNLPVMARTARGYSSAIMESLPYGATRQGSFGEPPPANTYPAFPITR